MRGGFSPLAPSFRRLWHVVAVRSMDMSELPDMHAWNPTVADQCLLPLASWTQLKPEIYDLQTSLYLAIQKMARINCGMQQTTATITLYFSS